MDWHVQGITDDGRYATVVFHIDIPNENNSTPISLRTAVAESIRPRNQDGTYGIFQSALVSIDALELTALQNGSKYEVVSTISFLADDTNLQKQNKIEAKFTALSTNVLNKLREKLKFWNKSGNAV